MIEEKKTSQNKVKDVAFKVAKATLKATIIYLFYFFLSPLLAPISAVVPGFKETIEMFVTVYILLMILGDLTEHTIIHYFFIMARSLFVIAYLIFSLGDGVVSASFENSSLTVNLTVFYTIAALLSLLGLARSLLQAINFMNERAESGIQP